LGTVKIAHDLKGGNISDDDPTVDASGFISSEGRIANVIIGGSVIVGSNTSSNGGLTKNASIRAGDVIGSIVVRGDVIGSIRAVGEFVEVDPVVFSAGGMKSTSLTVPTIGSIAVGGRVERANFLAGYDLNLNAVNGGATIGTVTVFGNWIASNLIAGVKDPEGDGFGNSDDTRIGQGNGNIISSIASVTIKGQVLGTPSSASPNDHYGFEVQQVGTVTFGGTSLPLKSGKSNDAIDLGITGDVTVREV
jgi:hypothetical protein